MARNIYNIKSFDDLIQAKQNLKQEIKRQEEEIKENPFIKISSAIYGKNAPKGSMQNKIYIDSIQSGVKFLKTMLFANKATRKYFLAYHIAKEMVPFALDKVDALLKRDA